MRAREEDLRSAWLTPYIIDECTDAVAIAESLSRQHFIPPDDRFAAAEIHHNVAVFHPFDDPINDVPDAVLVFLILPVTLRFTHLLHDYLLRRLSGDAAVFQRR